MNLLRCLSVTVLLPGFAEPHSLKKKTALVIELKDKSSGAFFPLSKGNALSKAPSHLRLGKSTSVTIKPIRKSGFQSSGYSSKNLMFARFKLGRPMSASRAFFDFSCSSSEFGRESVPK